jgi:HAD superfamily hydrolase (TIGR01450 family)
VTTPGTREAGRPPEITVDQLIERYAVLLLDAYGVLVSSAGALPGAADFIAGLNRRGTPYFILTNDASKLPATSARRYRGFGLAIDEARFITSGQLLEDHFAREGLTGARCVVLGPRDSVEYVERAGGRPVSPATEFDVLVVADESGFPFLETVDGVLSALFRAFDAGRTVHLVCPNPDLVYPSGNGFGIASGSVAGMLEAVLALRYPRRDLRFARLGKPNRAIFEAALRRSGTRDMVMVGDQLETDIRGARAFGIDAVLVMTGVTEDVAGVPADVRPTAVLSSLSAPA